MAIFSDSDRSRWIRDMSFDFSSSACLTAKRLPSEPIIFWVLRWIATKVTVPSRIYIAAIVKENRVFRLVADMG
ncbi:MAG: hypothetical protein ACD_75C00617G0002 [uncultured bacterium]|nr:MAG: hypothetical protein ACD_75C00617G0002 [uncultured bacterium]